MTTTKGARIAGMVAAMAAGFAGVAPLSAMAADSAKVQCSGVNECKGHGGCKSAKNACAGKNGCKGQGWVEMDEKDCKAKGGKVVAKK